MGWCSAPTVAGREEEGNQWLVTHLRCDSKLFRFRRREFEFCVILRHGEGRVVFAPT